MKKWIKALLITLIVLVVAAGGGVIWAYSVYSNPENAFKKPTSGPEITVKGQAPVPQPSAEAPKEDTVANILLLGIDSSSAREALHMGYRSDVMMLCQINFTKNTMVLLSVPRDTWAEFNVLDPKTGEVKGRTKNKINAAYGALGGGGPKYFGAKNTMDTISELLSCNGKLKIPIDYYVSIDIDGITKIASAVGGVEVVLDRSLPGVGRKGQTVLLKGTKADEYIRNRKNGGGGDTGRVGRQQEFILGIAKKIKEKGATSVAPGLYEQFLKYGQTNLSLEQVLALAGFAKDFSFDSISRYQVKNTVINGHYIPDLDELESFIRQNLVFEEAGITALGSES